MGWEGSIHLLAADERLVFTLPVIPYCASIHPLAQPRRPLVDGEGRGGGGGREGGKAALHEETLAFNHVLVDPGALGLGFIEEVGKRGFDWACWEVGGWVGLGWVEENEVVRMSWQL